VNNAETGSVLLASILASIFIAALVGALLYATGMLPAKASVMCGAAVFAFCVGTSIGAINLFVGKGNATAPPTRNEPGAHGVDYRTGRAPVEHFSSIPSSTEVRE
jgi:hypothetical protein